MPDPGCCRRTESPRYLCRYGGNVLFYVLDKRSRTKDYGCGQLCPWDRLGFEWHGLNTHNPLTEAVDGDFNLSAEALEAIATENRREESSVPGRL
jgi:hypothetical protein